MGIVNIFVSEVKSGYFGLYAGWFAIPTAILILISSILALIFRLNILNAISGFMIFILLLFFEIPILTSFASEGSILNRFLHFIRHPVSKAFFYIGFSFILWVSTSSLISIQSLAALLMSLTAALYLSAGLKRESIIDRYIIN
jgi:hypothetical protein